MKSFTLPYLLLVLILGRLCSLQAQTVPGSIVRAILENQASPAAEHTDTLVFSFHGGFAPVASAPSSQGKYLTEYTFGQPFATYASPRETFTEDILFASGGVYDALYPPGYRTAGGITQTKEQIETGGKPFRYKYLMFGEDPFPPPQRGEDGEPLVDGSGNQINKTPTIINIFESALNPESLFNEGDRNAIRAQIQVLREQLAYDPLNVELQDAFLEIHYDWAVAEAQFARSKMAQMLKFRMGFITPIDANLGKTAIDSEILTLESILADLSKVLDVYKLLLETEIDGINPSDFDPNAGGAPFGFYIFKTRQPFRSQHQTAFSTSSGGPIDPVDPGTVLFSGYKDYRTVLSILAEFNQRTADLAKLLGLRRGNGDTTAARNAITALSDLDARLKDKFKIMFQGKDFKNNPDLQGSGVHAAQEVARVARSEAEGVRAFLNGTTNILGFDPNFLLLVPSTEPLSETSTETLFDSFDNLMKQLDPDEGVGPLAIAKESYGDPNNPASGGGANQAFSDFRANVDTVITEFTALRENYKSEHIKLTGWDPSIVYDPNIEDSPGFDGRKPHPHRESRLKAANERMEALSDRNDILIALTNQLVKEGRAARRAVTLAKQIESKITGGQAKYLNDTASIWTEMHVWAGAAAGAQATAEATYALAGIDGITSFFSTGANVAAAAGAGALNLAAQTAAATRTSMLEQDLEEAAIALDVTIATADLPLTVQQAIMAENELYRQALSHHLEVEDNFTEQNVAISERNTILRDAELLRKRYDIDYGTLATSYYADPIFFTRAESALLTADAAFRDAQRWLFFTCRALEYKWQQKFWAQGLGGTSIDINSILTARNYPELEAIHEKMALYNLGRKDVAGSVQNHKTVISLRDHVLTTNPMDPNLDFSPVLIDSGERWSPRPGEADGGAYIPKVERFREILRSKVKPSGNLVIDIDTTRLRKLGELFRGPDFTNPDNSFSGNYRNKIEWVAVNVIAPQDAADPPSTAGGLFNLTYGGITWARNRVPVSPATRQPALPSEFKTELDNGGEYTATPFRYYQSLNLDLDDFDLKNSHDLGAKFLYSTKSYNADPAVRSAISGTDFRKDTFREYSTATSQLTLEVDVTQPGAQVLIENIEDIEIIIESQSYARPDID